MEEFEDIRKVEIIVRKDEKHLWDRFAAHHYMDHTLPRACGFFTFYAVIEQEEVLIGCLGVLMQIGKIPGKRITRFVILPEYQGLGYSSRILNGISEYYLQSGYMMYIVTFHPRLGEGLTRSDNWIETTNNQKSRNITTEQATKINNSSNNLRAGQKMYRFKYLPITDDNRPTLDILINFLGDDNSQKSIENVSLYEARKKEAIKIKYQESQAQKNQALDEQCLKGPIKKLRKKKRASPADLERLKRLKRT